MGVVWGKRGEVDGASCRVVVSLRAGHGLQQVVAHGAQVGQQHLLHIVLRVIEHGLEVEARGDDVLQFQCCLVARSLSAEVDVARQAVDDVGGGADEHVSIGAHILGCGRGGDGPRGRDGAAPGVGVLALGGDMYAHVQVVDTLEVADQAKAYGARHRAHLDAKLGGGEDLTVGRPHASLAARRGGHTAAGPLGA